jgi:uncharacterized BrkB/YihY/UPF0761 family membrane protein
VRAVLALIALVLVAAAVATAVIFATDDSAGNKIRDIAGTTVHDIATQIRDTVEGNKQ